MGVTREQRKVSLNSGDTPERCSSRSEEHPRCNSQLMDRDVMMRDFTSSGAMRLEWTRSLPQLCATPRYRPGIIL